MNNLSLLLYAADVFSSLGVFLFAIGFLGTIAGAILFLMSLDEDPGFDVVRPYRHTIFYTLTLMGVACLFPSKDTMYAIAASEMGEEVLKSGVGTRATKALEAWLDRQIEEQTEEQTSE